MCVCVYLQNHWQMMRIFKQGLIGIWNVTVLALYILLSQNDDIIKYRKWKQTIIIYKIMYWTL